MKIRRCPQLRQDLPRLQTLKLQNFRSYEALSFDIPLGLSVFLGKNGVGKTNLLEALSLFSPGRGLRRCDIADCARAQGDGSWSVAITLGKAPVFLDTQGNQDEESNEAAAHDNAPRVPVLTAQLGTGFLPREGDKEGRDNFMRRYRLDHATVSSARAFSDYVRVLWQTPNMDGLFLASPGERRRFLDRLVLALDPNHGARVNRLEQALRARNKLLSDVSLSGRSQSAWLNACEQELAGLAVAVASARVLLVQQLQQACNRQVAILAASHSEGVIHFPAVDLRLEGLVEDWLLEDQALVVEERYAQHLHGHRAKDQQAGRTLVGPHSSDMLVYFRDKAILAAKASTGEQKALLTGLVLAHAHLVRDESGIPPILLLDEIAAHFDAERRTSLLTLLHQLGGTVIMSGADPHQFEQTNVPVTQFLVSPGEIKKKGLTPDN